MFGISWTEFLVILLVAICVVPAKNWPVVIRFFARAFKYIREIIWKVSDFSDEVQRRIELEKPIDDLIVGGANEIFGDVTKKKNKITKKKITIKK
ncbi:MAG: hypothetical protein J6S57_03630 [Alphaproteobacteria bacterium]|nr:hypothetical protein [Alphaproteobacteria bacterium]